MTASAPRRSGPDAASVTIEPGTHTTPGGAATLRLHARNLATATRDLRLSVVGLEEGWRPPVGIVAAVAADETASVELILTPAAGSAPGDYPFLVVIETGIGGAWDSRTVADASLLVDGTSDVVLSIEPAEVRGVRRKRVDIVVGNLGLTAAEVALDGVGDGALDLDLSEASVLLQPAETVRVPATLRAPLRLAGAHERLSYQVMATGNAAPRRAQGTFTSRAVLSSGVLRVTAVVAVMALWIAAVVIALPRISDQFAQPDPTPTDAVDQQTGDATDPGAQADGGDGDAGGGGDGATGDEGTAGTDAEAAGLRVSGLVSGVEPGDVKIDVVPTSSLWATGMPADAAARVPARPGKIAAATMPMAPVGSTQRMSTRTNDSGVWALSGLSTSARYLVTISKAGFATQRVVMTGAELAAAPLETAMTAGEGSMSGVVSGPGGPVGGVELTLTDGTTTVTTRTATTGAVGQWHVDGLVTPSTYLVSAASADLGTQSQLVSLVASGSREVNLTLDAGVAAISGEVVGVDSLGGTGGLGGITVVATNGTTTRTATTVTGDGAGRFLLPRLPVPASYTVTVSGAGYSTVTREVNLTPSGVSGWTISLTSSGGAVTGTVTDDAGQGIAAAGLVLTHGSGTETIYKTMSASDGSGTFRFSGVAPGAYVLSAESFGHETTYAEVVVRAGGVVDVDLVLRRIPRDGLVATATIIGRVVDASTGGQIECPFIIEDEACVITATVAAEDLDGTSRTITSTAEPDDPYRLPATGSAVEGLLPGRYEVSITAPGYEPGRVTVTVPMGAEAEAATVALEPSPSLTGSVLARTGVLPDGACVVARTPGTPVITDPCGPDVPECAAATSRCAKVVDGMYRMDRLPAGPYTVTVENLSGGYVPPLEQTLNLLPGEIRRYDVVLERNGIVSATVMRSDGAGSVTPAESDDWVRVEAAGEVVGQPVQVGDDGYVQLTDLTPGTYTIIGSEEARTGALASTVVTIGLNQEINIQLVLAAAVQSQPVQVRYQAVAGTYLAIEDAQINVRGVISYTGTWPNRDDETFVTDGAGRVTICTAPSGDCPLWLGLVQDVVDVRITAPDFETYVANGVPLSSLSDVVLLPTARTFSGTAATEPAGSHEQIRFDVQEAPPGVVDPSLQVNADGTVTFTDRALPAGQIRPGHYVVVARLDGFASDPREFDIPLVSGVDVPAQRWVLRQDARLGIAATTEVIRDGVPTTIRVPGAVMTLTGPGELQLERTAGPSQTVLDFGTLPAGGGYTLQVRIAGYDELTISDLNIAPGATLANPMQVPVVRMGTITGDVVTVLGDGWTQALPGAVVTADEASPGSGSYDVTTRDDGSYTITGTLDQPGLANGDWDLSATAENHEAGADTTVATNLGTVTEAPPLGLAPTLSSLTVTVIDGPDTVPGLSARLVYSDAGRQLQLDPTRVEDGSYYFTDLLPLTYTLFLSGGGYMPLSTPVTIAAGTPQDLLVPITAPAGSIQGQVVRTVLGGSTVPVEASPLVQVQLRATGVDPVEVSIGDNGYEFSNVNAGAYTLAVQERADTTSDWTDVAVRVVSVLSGQSAVVDLVIPLISRPVAVTVTSTNGTDLAGGLVTLTSTVDGESLTLGPQPLGRSASGYTATFTQVPLGTWQASVSGPAGHHGSYRGAEVTITSSSPATVPMSVTVAESELRLQVVPPAGPDDPPGQVVVTATPGTVPGTITVGSVTTTMITGASDSVLYVPAIGWTLSVADPGDGWGATISPTSVPQTARALARVTLTPDAPIPTETGLGELPASIEIGQALTVTATVGVDGGAAPSGGQVTVQYRLAAADEWTDGGTAALTDGAAAVTLETDDWEAGAYSVRATYTAPEGWADSTSAVSSVTVTAPVVEEEGLAGDPAVEDDPGAEPDPVG